MQAVQDIDRYLGITRAGAWFQALPDGQPFAPGRFSRRPVSIAEGCGERKHDRRRELPVSREQLALMPTRPRRSMNQILKQWETRGLVRLSRGGISLLDIDGLRALAT